MQRVRRIFGSVLILWALGPPAGVAPAQDPPTDPQVLGALGEVARAFAKKDLDAILGRFGTGPDVVVFVQGLEQRLKGSAAIRDALSREFANPRSLNIKFSLTKAVSEGRVGWFATDAKVEVIAGREKERRSLRVTGVLLRREGKWLFDQVHISVEEGR